MFKPIEQRSQLEDRLIIHNQLAWLTDQHQALKAHVEQLETKDLQYRLEVAQFRQEFVHLMEKNQQFTKNLGKFWCDVENLVRTNLSTNLKSVPYSLENKSNTFAIKSHKYMDMEASMPRGRVSQMRDDSQQKLRQQGKQGMSAFQRFKIHKSNLINHNSIKQNQYNDPSQTQQNSHLLSSQIQNGVVIRRPKRKPKKIKQHLLWKERRVVCPEEDCGKTYIRIHDLRKHQNKVHGRKPLFKRTKKDPDYCMGEKFFCPLEISMDEIQ